MLLSPDFRHLKAAEIAERVGCSEDYVYKIRSRMRRKGRPIPRRSDPEKGSEARQAETWTPAGETPAPERNPSMVRGISHVQVKLSDPSGEVRQADPPKLPPAPPELPHVAPAAAAAAIAPVPDWTCGACGNIVAPESTYCPHCGRRFA